MARLCGVDLPRGKRIEIGLTYIYGVGLKRAQAVLAETGIDPSLRVKDLAEDDIVRLRAAIETVPVEGDLRRIVNQNIRRLTEIACYRGVRHRRKLPVRGQRTHTNARTKKGKRVAIAGKKKVTK